MQLRIGAADRIVERRNFDRVRTPVKVEQKKDAFVFLVDQFDVRIADQRNVAFGGQRDQLGLDRLRTEKERLVSYWSKRVWREDAGMWRLAFRVLRNRKLSSNPIGQMPVKSKLSGFA